MPPAPKLNDPLAPAKANRNAKQTAILKAATEVFVEAGFDLASMDRISERAGASKRTVYNYFPSKELLFEQVVEALFTRLHARKHVGWDAGVAVREQLRAFARAKSLDGESEVDVALTRVALAVYVRKPELAATMMQRMQDDSLECWLAAATAAGKLRVQEPIMAAQMFWAMAGGALFWPQLLGKKFDAAQVEAVVTEVVDTFLARFGTGG